MRSAIRVSALLILLGGCLGLVTAHHRAATVDETVGLGNTYAEIIDDYDREMDATGSISLAAVPRLSLSDEERGLVFLGVINLPNVPDARHARAGVRCADAPRRSSCRTSRPWSFAGSRSCRATNSSSSTTAFSW